jgi:hypothetical protein
MGLDIKLATIDGNEKPLLKLEASYFMYSRS